MESNDMIDEEHESQEITPQLQSQAIEFYKQIGDAEIMSHESSN